ncbi:MAG: hemin uptake protein HemP [Epsilonproteobacteria bacterium]|nr:hemin uptake protein HemP [Campylobacterota bacterium]
MAYDVRRIIDSKELFKKEKTVMISHEGTQYILRITKENKLILTK